MAIACHLAKRTARRETEPVHHRPHAAGAFGINDFDFGLGAMVDRKQAHQRCGHLPGCVVASANNIARSVVGRIDACCGIGRRSPIVKLDIVGEDLA